MEFQTVELARFPVVGNRSEQTQMKIAVDASWSGAPDIRAQIEGVWNGGDITFLGRNMSYVETKYCLTPKCGHAVTPSFRSCPKCGGTNFGGAAPHIAPAGDPRTDFASPGQKVFRPVTSGTYANFWMRLSAYFIDCIVFTALFVICILITSFFIVIISPIDYNDDTYVRSFSRMAHGIINALFIISIWLYYALMESSEKQGTLGKLAVGLKVTDEAGHRLGFGKATGRFFGIYISIFILGIGFLMIFWTERKQALHDKMAGTLVIKS